MKLEIYNAEPVPEESKITLRLIPSNKAGEGITLTVVDPETGERLLSGSILSVTSLGEVVFHTCVDPRFGFKLTSGGRVGTSLGRSTEESA